MAEPYSPEVKAAVLAALATGGSVAGVAREFGISRRTVTGWRDAASLPDGGTVAQEKKAHLDEQLFGYLQESIAALRSQLGVFTDQDWLKKQSAADLAILHGVITDKTTRLLGALRPDEPPALPGSETIDIPGDPRAGS